MARIRGTVLSIVAGLALSVGFIAGPGAPEAQAQMRVGTRMGGFGNADQITSTDIERFSTALELTKTQKASLDELFKGYEADFEVARKAMQDKFEKTQAEFQDTGDFSVWQKDWPETQEKYQTRTADLEKSLLSDLKAMLTPDQAKKWPSAERAQRRAKGLSGMNAPGITLAGDSVDLIKLVDEQKLDKRPETMVQLLDRYEAEMDQAIVERDTKRKDIGESFTKGAKKDKDGGGGGMPDFSKIGEMMGELRKSGIKVRDINDRYSTLIASAMPETSRDSFTMSYKKAKFPQIYKDPYCLKALGAAKDFKDLTSEQKSGIEEIVSKYKKEISAANERYARAQADAEKDGGGNDMMGGWMKMMGGGPDQGNDDSELSQARKARRKLDSDALDQLKGILTPEQVERLPERQNDMMMWGGGGKR